MKVIYFLLAFLFTSTCNAQLMGFKLPENKDNVEIPFSFQNNFIIVDLIFDDVFPLKFIFDTGSENTILLKKEFTDILDISYNREFTILGADLDTELTAYLIRGVNLDLTDLHGPNLDMLVLKEDYFQFESYTGIKIHGILGMDLFKVFTIEIDYQRQKLIFHRIEKFKPPTKKFKALDTEIHRNKPYLVAQAKINSDTATNVKLLLDTGASLSLLLHNNSAFDEYYFNGVITNFQALNQVSNARINYGRNGILGNEILSRFKVILDFAHTKIYLKPIKKYNKHFKYDKSGIQLIASGENLNQYTIKEITPTSPAAKAGLQKGDIILNINFTPTSFYDLRRITKIFQKRTNKRIRLMVLRDGEKKLFKFRLKDLI